MTATDPSAFTPETIRTIVLKRALRGYRRKDVDRLLRELADHEQAQRETLAEHERERDQLRTRVAELEAHDAQAAREVAGRAMLSAQQAGDELLERTKNLCDGAARDCEGRGRRRSGAFRGQSATDGDRARAQARAGARFGLHRPAARSLRRGRRRGPERRAAGPPARTLVTAVPPGGRA